MTDKDKELLSKILRDMERARVKINKMLETIRYTYGKGFTDPRNILENVDAMLETSIFLINTTGVLGETFLSNLIGGWDV
jgi:hypothetical protein